MTFRLFWTICGFAVGALTCYIICIIPPSQVPGISIGGMVVGFFCFNAMSMPVHHKYHESGKYETTNKLVHIRKINGKIRKINRKKARR